jgi:LmbE family N-acetylglucosaminyl deacetylase
MLKKKNTILVVAAHPDDEVLGCGGSMAKWAQSGDDVHILILAEGATARDKTRDRDARKSELSQLAKSAHEASGILGVKSINLLNLPDNRMDSLDLLDVVKEVENYINKLQPKIVVTHHIGDLNIDHHITHKAVITASRPQPWHPIKRILSFEVPSATEWQSPTLGNSFVPNWYEDISETLDLKLNALIAYKSEMRDWPHARSIKAVEHLARWRGASVGCEAAEAFMLVREIS